MKYDSRIHHRKSIRLKEYNYAQPGAYFVTLVTREHLNLFGEIIADEMRLNAVGEIIHSAWLRLPGFFPIRHDEWVIMPNHLHAILWILDSGTGEASANTDYKSSLSRTADASPLQQPIGTKPGSLGAIVQNFKSISTRNINQWIRDSDKGKRLTRIDMRLTTTRASAQRVWQRNYFERIIRNQIEMDHVREYIIDNPRKWAEDKEYHM